MGAEQLRVEDRILLHLQNYIKFADDYEVPRAMSQKGIGEAVWIAWSNVPRTMKKLRETDLVEERTTRVKGEFRKKKVYVLTPQGFAKAKELKDDLGRRRVNVVRGDEEREMDFSDLPEFVGYKLPYLELLRALDDDSKLDLERALRAYEEKVEMVDRTERAPKLREFVGRLEELADLHVLLEDHRIVVLHGLAGIGKTSLAVRLVEDLRRETNVLWVTLHRWDILPGVLGQVADFLADVGRRHCQGLLADHPSPELGDVYYPLEEDLKDLKGVLVFDDFQKASPAVVDMMTMLLEILEDHPSPTILLISRYQPAFYDRRYVVVRRVVGELQLGGLDRATARALLEGRGLNDEAIDRMYETTQGHPLALELLRETAEPASLRDVMTFVREEVFEGLSSAERLTLAVLSVHRANVPREATLAAASRAGRGPEVLDSLMDRGLVVDVGEEEVHVHDLVRDFFNSRLTPEERELYHREAAEAWGRLGTVDAVVERGYHLWQAGELEAAVATLVERGGDVLREPRLLREVLSILDGVSEGGTIATPTMDEAALLRADALARLDQLDAALAVYTRVLDSAVAEEESGQEARVLHRVGLLHARRGQGDLAIEVQRKALAAYEAVDDETGMAHCRMAISDTLAAREETEAAIEELGMAHESFTLMEDQRGAALACIRLGSINLDLEETAIARDYIEEALDNLDPSEDLQEVSRALYLLGEVDRLEEAWDQAVDHYEQALEIFQTVGDETMVANACNNLGDAYLALGDEERANLFYQRGMDLMVAQ